MALWAGFNQWQGILKDMGSLLGGQGQCAKTKPQTKFSASTK
jgi:hypothetical protein